MKVMSKRIALCALCFVVFALAYSGPSYAGLAAKTSAYLKEIGIDPESPDVKLAADDVISNREGTKDVSLDSLAAFRDQQGGRRFIATRSFIHRYMADQNTPFPKAHYDVAYLTDTEQHVIYCQIAKGLGAKIDGC